MRQSGLSQALKKWWKWSMKAKLIDMLPSLVCDSVLFSYLYILMVFFCCLLEPWFYVSKQFHDHLLWEATTSEFNITACRCLVSCISFGCYMWLTGKTYQGDLFVFLLLCFNCHFPSKTTWTSLVLFLQLFQNRTMRISGIGFYRPDAVPVIQSMFSKLKQAQITDPQSWKLAQ